MSLQRLGQKANGLAEIGALLHHLAQKHGGLGMLAQLQIQATQIEGRFHHSRPQRQCLGKAGASVAMAI